MRGSHLEISCACLAAVVAKCVDLHQTLRALRLIDALVFPIATFYLSKSNTIGCGQPHVSLEAISSLNLSFSVKLVLEITAFLYFGPAS